MSASKIMSEENKINPHKLILIDGYGFVFRAYHALARANMRRADGTPVGAVYAFTNMLIKTINDHEADYIAVVFDSGKKTFRNDIYSDYKANRPPAPEDLIPQFPLVREAAKALNLAIVEKDGYEADDLIATYARIGKKSGHDVVVISSDKDLMQLVGEGIEMFDPLKSRKIGVEEVVEKFGVAPDRLLDVLSLMGDSSDNVPGVPGIGPKTAAELVNRFGSLDEVLKNTAEIKQEKRRQTIEENTDKAMLSRDLIRLCYDVPVDAEIEDFVVKATDNDILLEFLREQGFKSIIAKFERGSIAAVKEAAAPEKKRLVSKDNELIDDIKNIAAWIKSAGEIKFLSFNFEINPKTGEYIGVSLSAGEKSCYIPLNVTSAPVQANLFGDTEEDNKSGGGGLKEVIVSLKDIFEDKSVIKIAHNVKELIKATDACGVAASPLDDIMVMSYTLEAGMHKHDLDNIIIRHHSEETDDLLDVKSLVDMEPEKAMFYACKKSHAMLNLHRIFKYRLFKEKSLTLYEKIEKPLISVLAAVESNGIKIDTGLLKGLSDRFLKQAAELESEIYSLAECEFNIGSPKQLGEVLFDKMGVQGGKKSKKTGAYSTDVKVLQSLADEGNLFAEKVLAWRHVSKMKSTYTDALPKLIGDDGRLHTTFEMAATSTGRLSSRDPNLQNIPIRSEEGNKIREAFIAEKGCKLLSADYSQIELRLLAHMADMPILQDAFKKNLDIHAATASQMFGVDIADVDSELRRKAKMINFGIIYGISAFGLAQRLGIGRNEAGEYIKQYFLQYPGIEEYMAKTVEFAREHSYVETLWGRKCYVNGINDRNAGIRQFSERAAINAPLQGTAADIIKKAMAVLADKIKLQGFKAKILLQVHDELVLEAPESEVEKVGVLLKNVMENVIELSVPTVVDVGIGDNWREIH